MQQVQQQIMRQQRLGSRLCVVGKVVVMKSKSVKVEVEVKVEMRRSRRDFKKAHESED